MSLWEYANPVKFLSFSGKIVPWFAAGAALFIAVGLYWGYFLTPDDYKQGSTVKIIYLHVPAALIAINAWFMMLVASLIWLIRRHHVSALAARAAAPIGIVMTLITLITGALWGQPMWGTPWVWDARLTSMLVLFFLYLGYMALGDAFERQEQGDRAAAILALVGSINLPIIKFSVDWWNTLHQPSIFSMAGISVDSEMLAPLFLMVGAFQSYYVVVILMRVRAQVLSAKVRAARLMQAAG